MGINDDAKLENLSIKWLNSEIDDLTFVEGVKNINTFNRNRYIDIETTLILKYLYKKYILDVGIVSDYSSDYFVYLTKFYSDGKIDELIQTIIYRNRESNINKLND